MNLMANVRAVFGNRDNMVYLYVDDVVKLKLKFTKERSQMRSVKFLAANAIFVLN
jgi:hypothetical protein